MARSYFCLLLLLLCPHPVDAREKSPRLVVLILMDQFRADYITRFEPDFLPPQQADGKPGGFRFLKEKAAFHSRCFYDHWPTHTAVGHAAISTGALPSVSGIVNNYWMDRDTGSKIDVGRDPSTILIGSGKRLMGSSPHHLQAPTIGDAMKLQTGGRSKVFGVAAKDRAAILATGTMADQAFWFSPKVGRWVSSSFYGSELPPYINELNESDWAESLHKRAWTRTLPKDSYARSRGPGQSGVYEDWAGIGADFPHPLDGGKDVPSPSSYMALTFSPAAIAKTFDLAEQIILEERLGDDAYPDLLTVGLSIGDKVGHAFGPYSPEVQEITVQADRELADFLAFLESRPGGLEDVLVVVTSDHGVAPLPEYAASLKLVGGRIEPNDVRNAVNKAIGDVFGAADYIRGFHDPHLYLELSSLSLDQQAEAEELAAEAIRDLAGVQNAITADSLRRGSYLYTPLGQRVSKSFFRGRSGDILIVRKPNWIVNYDVPKGTTHGSGWTHDTHVPLFFLGAGTPAGRYRGNCTPRDIAPTLAEVLEITPPSGADGDLMEWLR